MKRIDLNVDLAEGAGFDDELLRYASSASLCCGAHAGAWEETLRVAERCEAQGVRIGAHPGYPDRANRGRKPLTEAEIEGVEADLADQVRRLIVAAPVRYIKPHGAFYHQSAENLECAASRILNEILRETGLPLLGLGGTAHEALAARAGVGFLREGFADRAYTPEGRLRPRGEPGAIRQDPEAVCAQAVWLADRVDSICLHGDTPGAVDFARRLRDALESAGFEVKT